MRFVSLAGLGIVTGFSALSVISAAPAFALSIANMDADPHTMTVTVGGAAKQLTVDPNKGVQADCGSGCKIKLENGEEYDFKGTETISIEGGTIFVDSSPDADDKDAPNLDPDAGPGPAPDRAKP
jgi:hypothetical protein